LEGNRRRRLDMSRKIRTVLVLLLGTFWLVLVGCDTPEEVYVEEYPTRVETNQTGETAGENATQTPEQNATGPQ
jgi:hypothetical protein